MVLVLAAQGSRRGAYYYEDYREEWRHLIWVAYHGGIIALLAGLGAALVPQEGLAGQPGVAGQQGLRWAAAGVAFAAAFGELLLVVWTLAKRRKRRKGLLNGNYDKLAVLLEGRNDWRPEEQGRKRFWCFGVDGAARLVIAPETDGFLMYRADENQSWVVPRIESVEEWLDANEAEHSGPTAVQLEFREALERAREQRGGDQAGS